MGAGASLGAAGVFALSALLDPGTARATLPQAPAPFEPPTAGKTLPTRLTGSFVSAARTAPGPAAGWRARCPDPAGR
ncbi:hypothetical protein MAHJHV60_47500 [Mycobacterium avium subsp. hominissuis]